MLMINSSTHSCHATDNLAVSAQGFRRGANRVRKQMWWKDMKMRSKSPTQGVSESKHGRIECSSHSYVCSLSRALSRNDGRNPQQSSLVVSIPNSFL